MYYPGNISFDATVRETEKGTVLTFGLAITESYYNRAKKEWVKEVEFYQCDYWNVPALAPLLKKGAPVVVDGFNQLHKYEKRDGSFGAKNVIKVRHVQFLGKNSQQAALAQLEVAEPVAEAVGAAAGEPSDDLPF